MTDFKETEDGIELDPPLELIEPEHVTARTFERGLLALGIDPDDVLAGREVELPKHPKWDNVNYFFDLVVENADQYDLAEWPVGRLKSVLAVIVDHFMSAPLQKSRQPARS